MAVVLRLRRTGRKNLPCFRIVATDSRFPRDGRQIETVGLYDPLRKDEEKRIQVDLERVQHWLAVGAKPSDIVASILRRRGVHARVPKKRRERAGRGTATKASERRKAADEARAAAKKARLLESRKQKRAAKKAAAAAGASKEEKT